jgi:hypothetical protein
MLTDVADNFSLENFLHSTLKLAAFNASLPDDQVVKRSLVAHDAASPLKTAKGRKLSFLPSFRA